MDLEIIMLSEVNQIEKDKYHMIFDHLYVESQKVIQMNLQNRNRLTDIQNRLVATKGGEWVGKG